MVDCFSSEVIATPNGSPPAELLVEMINRELSKHDVESQNITGQPSPLAMPATPIKASRGKRTVDIPYP